MGRLEDENTSAWSWQQRLAITDAWTSQPCGYRASPVPTTMREPHPGPSTLVLITMDNRATQWNAARTRLARITASSQSLLFRQPLLEPTGGRQYSTRRP